MGLGNENYKFQFLHFKIFNYRIDTITFLFLVYIAKFELKCWYVTEFIICLFLDSLIHKLEIVVSGKFLF